MIVSLIFPNSPQKESISQLEYGGGSRRLKVRPGTSVILGNRAWILYITTACAGHR